MSKIITINEAAEILTAGKIIAYPTEGVYGLGCDPRNLTAVAELLALKKREASKGLILVGSDPAQFSSYLANFPDCITSEVAATWPGPVTWLLPVTEDVSQLLRGDFATQAVRVSAHSVVRDLCAEFGHAIVSTSANIGGEPPCMTAREVIARLGNAIAGVVAGELGGAGKPTEIRSIDGKIIRSS